MLKNAGIRVCGENSVPTRCRLQIYNEKEPWIGSRERNGEPSVKTMSADLVRAINGSSAEPARQRGRLRSSRVGQRLPTAFRGAPRSAATIWEGSFFLDSSRRRASEMATLSVSPRASGGVDIKSDMADSVITGTPPIMLVQSWAASALERRDDRWEVLIAAAMASSPPHPRPAIPLTNPPPVPVGSLALRAS